MKLNKTELGFLGAGLVTTGIGSLLLYSFARDCSQIERSLPEVRRVEQIEGELARMLLDLETQEALDKFVNDQQFATNYKSLREEYNTLMKDPEIADARKKISINAVYGAIAGITAGIGVLALMVGAKLYQNRRVHEKE